MASPSEIQRGGAIFCSQDCYYKHQGPTSIEEQVSTALDMLCIQHSPQTSFQDTRFIFDEYIPPNILIEVQGDYWHNREDARKRDQRKARWAKKSGYELILIWENEINERGAWSLVIERVLPLLER